MIRIENIRDMAKEKDVKRFLIDREWPKDVVRSIPHKEKSGQTRTALALIEWSPELAPSPTLWKWFHHDSDKIGLFRSRYFRELQGNKKYWIAIAQESEKNEVVLLYHGKRVYLTPAHFLKEFLEFQLETHQIPTQTRKKCVSLPGQGVAAPVEKSISRKRGLPLKKEMSFMPKQKLTQVPAERRRVL
jgi:uncharacterized protein YeaO (DUF488 family)